MLNKTVTIPISKLEWLSEKLEALASTMIKFRLLRRTMQQRNGQVYELAEIEVWGGQPGDDRWKFYGEVRWDENTGENVIEVFPGLELEAVPESFRTSGRTCDYCHTVRRRIMTYIVFQVDTEQWMQIGSTCVQKLTKGITAAELAAQAAILREAQSYVQQAAETEPESAGYEMLSYLYAAFEARSREPEADNHRLHTLTVSLLSETWPEHAARVEGVLAQVEAWREQSQQAISNFAHNVTVALATGYIKPEHTNIVQALTRTRLENSSYTEYFGEAGRQEEVYGLTLITAFYVASRDFWINKFDLDGRLLVWMTGRAFVPGRYQGTLRVRSHQEFEGQATTYIHYCRLELMDEE